MKSYFKLLAIFFIFGLAIMIFYGGFFNYFFQDDFINIYLGWLQTPRDIGKLSYVFIENPYNAYRPIAYYLFGLIIIYILHLNSFITHFILFLIHLTNIILLWRFLETFISSKKLIFLTIFLYALSSIHFGILYWWTTDYLSLGTLFLLVNLLLIKRYESLPTNLKYGSIIILYIITILTNEALFVLPLLLLVFHYLFHTKNIQKLIIPITIISLGSFVFRYSISKFRELPDYSLGTINEIYKSIQWYLLRAFNLPEGIRALGSISLGITLMVFVGLLFIFLIAIYFSWKNMNQDRLHIFIFGISWYLIFGFPFFLLPHHLSSFYLHTALIGISLSTASVLSSFLMNKSILRKIIIFIFCGGYAVLSYLNIMYFQKAHWIVRRAEIAKNYIKKTMDLYPSLPKGASIVFKNTNIPLSEIEIVLAKDKALQLIYNDPTLQVYYKTDSDEIYCPYIVSN